MGATSCVVRESGLRTTTFSIAKSVPGPYEEVFESVKQKLVDANFRIIAMHDMKMKFMKGGVVDESYPELRMIEACDPRDAHEILEHDIDSIMFLPCKVVVRQLPGENQNEVMMPNMDYAEKKIRSGGVVEVMRRAMERGHTVFRRWEEVRSEE